jgi:hypothetical protein
MILPEFAGDESYRGNPNIEVPPLQPGNNILYRAKLGISALVLGISALHGDSGTAIPENTPYYVVSAAATSGESSVCTTTIDKELTIDLDCLPQKFPHSPSSAVANIASATLTLNVYSPKSYEVDGGQLVDGATVVKVSPDQVISAGHTLAKSSQTSFGTIGSACGAGTNVENVSGLITPMTELWTNFSETSNMESTPDLAKSEVPRNPDVAVMKVGESAAFEGLPTASFAANPNEVLQTGDPLIISSDQPDGEGAMRNETNDPVSLQNTDLVDSVYLGRNKLNPSTFFILTGIGSESGLDEPAVPTGGASGSDVVIPGSGEGVGLFVDGRHNGANQPIPVSGKAILKETGVRVVDAHGQLVSTAYLDLVQAIPSVKTMVDASRLQCHN